MRYKKEIMLLRFIGQRFWNCLTVSACKLDNSRGEKCVFLRYGTTRRATSTVSETQLKSRTWSVMFFGTDEFALHSFKILNERYRSQRLIKRLEVVTAYKGKENAIIHYANQNGIPVHSWPLTIPLSQFDLGLVVSFGHMIPTEMIDAFPLGMINVHASLLPKLRGAAPIIHALKNGDSKTGITIMKIMPDKFDIGEILAQEEVDILADETMPELYVKLAKLGADLLIKTLEKLPHVLSQGRKQSDDQATYARKITAKASAIRWNEMSAKNVYDLQRSLTGLYYLTAKLEDKTIKLLGIRVYDEETSFANLNEQKPGCAIYDKQRNVLLAKCKDETWISIGEIVVPGRRPMSARDFKNGFITKHKKSSIYFQ